MSKSAPNRSLLILLIVAAVAAAGWFAWQQFGTTSSTAPKKSSVVKSSKKKALAEKTELQDTSGVNTANADNTASASVDTASKASPDQPAGPVTGEVQHAPVMASTQSDKSHTPSADAAPPQPASYALPRGDLRYCLDLKDNHKIAHCAVTQR